jgi:Ras-related GTP-binding protein C/D
MDKTFLFDIHSRIYVATDGSPIEQSTFDLCSDYLEKLLQFRALYKYATARNSSADCRNIKPSRPTKSRTTTNSSLSVPIGDLTISNGKPAGAVEETEDDDGIGPEDEEDPDAPWVTQSTRLLPNTTIAYWEFTP